MAEATTVSFGERLRDALHEYGPLCLGIDPSRELLDGWELEDSGDGLAAFCDAALAAALGTVGVIKPQAAFFERHGSSGIAVLEDLCRNARAAGALVILDAKRGDIGSTCQAYAEAYLTPTSPVSVDAMTVSPYLGLGSLTPLLDTATAHGRGLFILARTSNPENADVQCAKSSSGHVAADIMAGVAAYNLSRAELSPSIGVVFGATVETTGYDLAGLGGPILVPGIGAQGASAADAAARFAACRSQIVPTVSRAVLAAGPRPAELRARLEAIKSDITEAFE